MKRYTINSQEQKVPVVLLCSMDWKLVSPEGQRKSVDVLPSMTTVHRLLAAGHDTLWPLPPHN